MSAFEKLLNKISQAFDFIEVRLQRLTEKTDLWIAKAQNVSSLTTSLKYYNNALKVVEKSIKANQKGYDKYRSYYKSVASRAINNAPSTKKTSKSTNQKLLRKYFARVRDGSINITEIKNDKIRSMVEEYKNWYDKARNCKQQIEELKAQQQELAQTKLSKVIEYYDALISRFQTLVSYQSQLSEYNNARGLDTSSNKIKSQKDQISLLKQQARQQKNEYNKYLSTYNANKKYMTEQQRNEALAQLESFRTAINETETSIANARSEIDKIQLEKLERVTEKFERIATALDHRYEMRETHGDYETKEQYETQIGANNDTITSLKAEQKKYEEEMAKYSVGSEKYEEALAGWREKQSAIWDLQKENEELRQKAIQVPFTESNRTISTRNTRVDENNQAIGLLNQDNLVDSDTGKITTDGLAKIALLTDNIRQIELNSADLQEQKKALETLHDNGQIGDSAFQQQLEEINNQLREGAVNANEYKQQIVDLSKTNMQSELNALLKVIDKRKEALSRKKDYYDYDKSIKSQTKDLQALEAQRAALEGVEGSAAEAQRRKLDAQIQDAKDQMDDTKKDHQYSMEVQGYDDLSTKLQEALEKQLKLLNSSLEEQGKVIENFLNKIGTSWEDVFKKITDTVSNSGMSSGMSNQYNSEYNNSSNGKTPSENASNVQQENSSITGNLTNPDTSVNGTTGITGNTVDSSSVDVGDTTTSKVPSTAKRALVSFELSIKKWTIACGSKKTIKVVRISPGDATVGTSFKWTSSNTKIATVSKSGKTATVTANSKYRTGSTTITCRSSNGVVATATITVYTNKIQKLGKKYGLTLKAGKPYTAAQKKKFSNLNKHLASKGFSIVENPTGVKKLGKKLGVITNKNSKKGGEFYVKKGAKYNSKQVNKIYSKLKAAGLRDGGVIDGVVPISKLNSVVNSNHDHGIATVRRDEILLKPETSEMLKQAVQISESIVKDAKTKDIVQTSGGYSSYYESLIKVEAGAMVDRSVINDLKAVAKQVYDEQQSNKIKEHHKIGRKPKFGR